jgi:DNA-directed RNA polymerase specialized sigma24 family protein
MADEVHARSTGNSIEGEQMTANTFAQAYTQGYRRTTEFLLSRGVNRDAASDLAQGAWARAWERIHQLRDETAVLSWVNTIALRLHFQSFRNSGKEEPLQPYHLARLTIKQNLAAIDVSRILPRCRPADRKLLNDYMQGTSTDEIAQSTKASPTAIRIRLMRARRAARQLCPTS